MLFRYGKVVLLCLILGLSGCATATIDTARQLESGESVVSGSIDIVPQAPLPRVHATTIWGFQHGDFRVHGGVGLQSQVNAGASGNLYLSEYLTMGLKVDAGVHLLALADETFIGGVAAIPKLQTTVDENRWLYGGVQAAFFTGTEPTIGLLPAGIIGIERSVDREDSSLQSWQLQLAVTPLMFQELGAEPTFYESGGFFIPSYTVAAMFSVISIGGTWGR